MLPPIIGVALAVEPLGWTGVPSVFAHRLRRRWTAVPQQSASPYAALSRIGHAVEIWGMKQGPSHKLQQPVDPIAGALRCWVSIERTEPRAFSAPIQGRALPHAGRPCRRGPCPQAPQTLGTSPCARRVIRRPHPLVDLSQRVAPGAGGASTDGEPCRETTPAPRAGGAQGRPRALRGLPAIGLDRLRRISGIHGLRCTGKNARRCVPGSLGGGRGHGGAQETGVRCGGGAVHPRALQPAMLCIGHQVLGALLGGLDRRANEPAATQTLFQALPGHRIVATHVRHGPTGPRQAPHGPRVVNVLGTPRPGRHDQGGCDGKDRTTVIQTQAATQERRCARGLCTTAERLAPWQRLRQQLGTLPVRASSRSCASKRSVRKRSYADSARGKRIVRYPFWGGCAPVVMPSSMGEDGVGESTLTSRNRGRHSTSLQTINRISYNQDHCYH
jgi:hypothetical protein